MKHKKFAGGIVLVIESEDENIVVVVVVVVDRVIINCYKKYNSRAMLKCRKSEDEIDLLTLLNTASCISRFVSSRHRCIGGSS